jgi:hypothetical protein
MSNVQVMTKKVLKVNSVKEQKEAVIKARQQASETPLGNLISLAGELLVSKNGQQLASELLTKLSNISDEYPIDVVAETSLQFAHGRASSLIAFLELHKEGETILA